MREIRSLGSVRGVPGNRGPYREGLRRLGGLGTGAFFRNVLEEEVLRIP